MFNRHAIRTAIFSLIAISSASASTIQVSELLCASPGTATINIKFFGTAGEPVATFLTHVVFDNTKFRNIVATGINGGSCSVDQQNGFVSVQGPGGQNDLPTAIYCSLVVMTAPHIPPNTFVWLTPTVSGPNFNDGGCFSADALPINCLLAAGNVVINNFPNYFIDGFDNF